MRISHKFLVELEECLHNAKLATFPDVTDPSNGRLTRIRFFDSDTPIQGFQHPRQLFAEEKQLERFLWLNRTVMPYVNEAGLRISGREIHIADNCIIDLLAEDRKTRELVGFELKVAEAHDRLVGQAAKYMQALSHQAEAEGRPGARLLIVTGQPDQSLAEMVQGHAEEYGVKTEWLLYRVSIDLMPYQG